MNNINLIGRIGQEPEARDTENGKRLVKFSLAVYRNKENTDWINCEAWEKTAELIEQYVNQGDQVGITGRMQEDKWEKDGEKRRTHKVVVTNVTLLSNKKKEDGEEKQPVTAGSAGGKKEKSPKINDEDIPF